MMNRFVAILLMPFLVVGNSLAHSHGSAAHPSQSQGRAHFHVGSTPQQGHEHKSHGHSHHGHSHDHSHDHDHDQDHESDDSQPAPLEKPVGHDSDAVYLVAADFVYITSDRTSIEVGSYAVIEKVEDYLAEVRPPASRDLRIRSTTPELPLYLLHAALRL